MISPSVIRNTIFEYCVEHEPFQVRTAHGITKHENIAFLPLPPQFNTDKFHKFLIFDFDVKYKGIIGMDLLEELGCTIDLKNRVLKSSSCQIPIYLDYPVKKLRVEPRCEKLITVKTNYADGQYICDDYCWSKGLKSPASVVTVKNGSFRTSVINSTDDKKIILNNRPLVLEPLPQKLRLDIETVKLNKLDTQDNIDIDNELRQNLTKIRTDHMNEEEKREITKLCFNYRNIFHSDNIPLSFTHTVKHELRLTDDTPIFVRSYRQAPQQRKEIEINGV